MVTAVSDFSAMILYPAICSASCNLLFLSSCRLFYITLLQFPCLTFGPLVEFYLRFFCFLMKILQKIRILHQKLTWTSSFRFRRGREICVVAVLLFTKQESSLLTLCYLLFQKRKTSPCKQPTLLSQNRNCPL